uniref:Uncharacterized protein n=1 Tax=Chrysotila carterae TaxID=13221 RepID=A0A7S4BNX1_CHRCT
MQRFSDPRGSRREIDLGYVEKASTLASRALSWTFPGTDARDRGGRERESEIVRGRGSECAVRRNWEGVARRGEREGEALFQRRSRHQCKHLTVAQWEHLASFSAERMRLVGAAD